MLKPPHAFTPPDFTGQTKILFCCEGNGTAMVVTVKAGRRRQRHKQIASAEEALAWCRRNQFTLVYFPASVPFNPDSN